MLPARPGSFLHFIEHVIKGNPKPTPAQQVYVRVIFDREEPGDLADADRAIASELFGDIDTIPPNARHVVCSLKGARVGGTLFHSLYLLFAGLTQPLQGLSAGEVAFGAIVAPDLRLAAQALRYVTGTVDATPSIVRLVTARTATSVTLKRPHDGQLVTIECLPATRGGSALRGRSYFGGLLDEASFFRDDAAIVNDAELYGAIAPRIIPGGLLSVISTPHAELGLLWQKVSTEFGAPRSCLAVKARTLTLRPDLRRFVESERERDPAKAAREFDLIAWSNSTGLFFDLDAITAAVNPRLQTPLTPRPGLRASAGLDLGLISDASAGVILYQYPGKVASYAVAETLELLPSKGNPLKLSRVCATVAGLLKRHNVNKGMLDGYSREPAKEYFSPEGITLLSAPAGNAGKLESYLALRQLINQQQLALPSNEPRLVQQLREVVCKPLAGGGLSISSPRKAGHGDVLSALVLATWQFTGGRKSTMALYLETATREKLADFDRDKPWKPDWGDLCSGTPSMQER